MNGVKIMLLGSIPKGDSARQQFGDWKTDYVRVLKEKIPGVDLLYGDLISDSAGPELVVGHDIWLIRHADFIVVNAESKIGAGTAQEMVLAKHCQKPVATVLPKDTHHRRSNVAFGGTNIPDWIHPFILASSDYIGENINQVADWIISCRSKPGPVKDLREFDRLVDKFEQELKDIVREYKRLGW